MAMSESGYQCDVCGESFDKRCSLGGHKHHHETEYAPEFTDGELLDHLISIADEIGHTPSKREFQELSSHSHTTYVERFGCWNDAVEAAGLDHVQVHSVPRKEFLTAIRNLADELGRAPTRLEMDSMGDRDSSLYQSKFGSWNEAIEAAGLEPRYPDATGEDRWNWKGGNRKYGEGWTEEKRKTIRERDGYECSRCGLSQEQHKEQHGMRLHVHHITPAKEIEDADKRNAPSNLTALCITCHNKVEDKSREE